ncbi:MAG: 3-phosphoshikimate 1-carboxyvinyltransferase, partial [Elusimicrobia bacterium]|nr:3-phosphoshikimate 1-carboxyvinyltransferase [Elusimicrobiota bacterium]
MRLTVRPCRPLRGAVVAPGDKSLAHRALIFAALAEGVSRIAALPGSADVRSTIACLRALGVRIGAGRVQGLGG